jgi:hypothetical protein
MLLAAGFLVAHQFEKRRDGRKQKIQEKEAFDSNQKMMDDALEDSFPASDPPNFSPSTASPGEYHH